MKQGWMTPLASAALAALLIGPALAQTGGSGAGTSGSGSGAGTSGTTPSPQPTPSPAQPGAPTDATKSTPGAAQSGSGQSGSGQMGTKQPGAMSDQASGKAGSKSAGVTNGQASSEQVKSLQKALQDKGMDPGPIDGVMGPKTAAALRAYQKDQNLPQTGRMDPETMAKLGVSR